MQFRWELYLAEKVEKKVEEEIKEMKAKGIKIGSIPECEQPTASILRENEDALRYIWEKYYKD